MNLRSLFANPTFNFDYGITSNYDTITTLPLSEYLPCVVRRLVVVHRSPYTGPSRPSAFTCSSKAGLASGFVRISATISFVGQYTISISLSIWSLIKWYRMSICLVLAWWTGFSARIIHDWLSSKIVVGFFEEGYSYWTSLNRDRNQRASWTEVHKAMYSASVVESAIVGCRLEHQLIAPLLRVKIHGSLIRS